ncbi:pilus assembly protein, pilin component [Aromatoleum aromaticum EbN1]|uniref:Pilus assembly protein, pilin component n=1 Tax=Aromatoleum aromaticum (strain DSM 19018 / LMG 30748 / EbN1) TaxID=76114 RepID=Q5P392_AROAE|nr:Flp family type IVb pilin [Aromatoleum aromaticum]CAI08222.1 pilus assembly protein, pilin component [Aromatoleum aromaticum EbN1]
MKAMKTERIVELLKGFIEDQDGVTSIEYALLAALIFGAIVVSVSLLGSSVETLYGDVADKVSAAVS